MDGNLSYSGKSGKTPVRKVLRAEEEDALWMVMQAEGAAGTAGR